MGLAALTDAVSAHLSTAIVPAPALVGASYPSLTADLPAVVISFTGITEPMRGVGMVPAASVTGALPVTTNVDLANPVATFPDEIVNLLSADRMTLTLPQGPLVAADGTSTTFPARTSRRHSAPRRLTSSTQHRRQARYNRIRISERSSLERRCRGPARWWSRTSSANGRSGPSATRASSWSRPSRRTVLAWTRSVAPSRRRCVAPAGAPLAGLQRIDADVLGSDRGGSAGPSRARGPGVGICVRLRADRA